MKSAGWQLSYSQETEDQLVQWVLEMRDLHLLVSVVQVKERARQLIQPQVFAFHMRLPAGLEGKMTSYLQKLQERKNGRLPNALIRNMDETPVYF